MVLTPTRLSPRFIFCSPIVNCGNRLAQNSAKDMGFPSVGLQLSPLVRSYCICRWSYGKYLTLLTWREWQPVVDVYVNLWKELFDNWKHDNFFLRVADASIATNSRFNRRILREPRKYKKILFLSYCISNSHSIWCFQLLRSTLLSLHIFDKLSLATGEQPQIFVVILTKTTGDSRLRRLGCFLRAFPKGGAQMCFFPERPTRLLIKF